MNLLKKTPVLSYFAIIFLISWGGIFILGYPYGMPSTNEQFQALWTAVVLLCFLGPALAGLLMTAITGGRAGFRELRDRLFKWRIGLKWYANALMAAPLVFVATHFFLAQFPTVYLPGFLTVRDGSTLILMGIISGIMAGILEVVGWFGFAIPEMRKRNSPLATDKHFESYE